MALRKPPLDTESRNPSSHEEVGSQWEQGVLSPVCHLLLGCFVLVIFTSTKFQPPCSLPKIKSQSRHAPSGQNYIPRVVCPILRQMTKSFEMHVLQKYGLVFNDGSSPCNWFIPINLTNDTTSPLQAPSCQYPSEHHRNPRLLLVYSSHVTYRYLI